MTEAKCPLVREIEEAAVRFAVDDMPSLEEIYAHHILRTQHWSRIRAALEAAHVLRAAVNPQTCTDDVLAAMQAYDEATRKP